ncbi:uncharacterized protein yc1106_06571 [Curvularia clavata]|uniref:FAD/NAD(P)-binding domain-containing protein n=1 Tax=Curvularia clavata TaxID=95742 RepID=A0A9Q9DTZ9_CURCL|nr:uncharacterized protein yc1106_06571 [Curvularia clavata]
MTRTLNFDLMPVGLSVQGACKFGFERRSDISAPANPSRRSETDKIPSQTKNVVVVGGSFTGYSTAKYLTETLPTGYRVVLVEKNSHFNYVFAFPRFSVMKGCERLAFIPYTGLEKSAPKGVFEFVQGMVEKVDERVVRLEGGKELEYEYLIIATGTSSGLPSKVAATESPDAQQELRGLQSKIEKAARIAVVGGGAVGVELASDIKDFYPEKSVVLLHSRDRLLPSFGERLHEYVMKRLGDMGVEVWLNERPQIVDGSHTLKLKHGKEETFDLIIPCTGQRPNSSVISDFSWESISKDSSHILVRPTLQIVDERFPNVFAAGDVAATGGPKMGRAGYMQTLVVAENVLSLIKGKNDLKVYQPLRWLEGSIKLTLGKVTYASESAEREILMPSNSGKIDIDAKKAWRHFGEKARASEYLPTIFESITSLQTRTACSFAAWPLCVSPEYRRKGLATQGENDWGFGILSSNPAAVMALLRACDHGIENASFDMVKEYGANIMATSPIRYVREAKLKGRVFGIEEGTGTMCCADTNFWVDHAEPLAILAEVKKKITWPFGELPEGCEFLALIHSPSTTSH